MKINIIVKVLIVKGILCFPLSAFAWTVSEKADEQSNHIHSTASSVETVAAPILMKRAETAKEPIQKVSENNHGPMFQKKPAHLSLEERVTSEYGRAIEYLNNREFQQAETILLENLQLMPRHHRSRVELATYYLKNHQQEQAEIILHEGLRFDESNPEFLRLMAVICDRQEEPERALSLLMKVKESQRQDGNYLSFLGHIYQQLGSYSLARQQYFKLLQREPQNPLWLLGVSVALDAEGQSAAALEGYQRLNKEANFEPDVRQYIKERIRNLKG